MECLESSTRTVRDQVARVLVGSNLDHATVIHERFAMSEEGALCLVGSSLPGGCRHPIGVLILESAEGLKRRFRRRMTPFVADMRIPGVDLDDLRQRAAEAVARMRGPAA